jgi:hypothetical protein
VALFADDGSVTVQGGVMMFEQTDVCWLEPRKIRLERLKTVSDTAPTPLSAVPR